MKERKFLRIFALLVATVLTITSAFSNYNFVKAADNDVTENTESNKELVQCSDDWVIFKYKDENGDPQFDVKYQGKTLEELNNEGTEIKYMLILKGANHELFNAKYETFYGKITVEDYFLEYPEEIFVKFVLGQFGSNIVSDVIPLYSSNDSSPYILFTNFNYLEIYHITDDNPSKFKVEMKVSEHLKKTGDLSVSKKMASTSDDIEKVSTSNLTFENYSKENVIEGESYNTEYSIVTFDLELPSKYFYTNEEESVSQQFSIYIFSFNGIVGINSNNPIENLQFDVLTPASLYDPTADISVQSIKITSSSSSIKVGDLIKLSTTILPNDATNKTLTWRSSNPDYATVDDNGIVTAKPAGAGKTVTITVKATDGSNVSASFKLKINKVLVKKIKLKAKKSLKVGKKLKIKLTINSDATNKNVKWSVSNKKYAKINSKGILTAKKAGKGKTIKVTVKAKDGSGKKATIKIKIK